MFESLKHKRVLKRFDSWEKKIETKYDEEIKRAQSEKKEREEIESIKHSKFFEILKNDQERSEFLTGYLIKKANRYVIPIPKHDDEQMWDEGQMGYRFLTYEGINNLRSEIRREEKERRDAFLSWIPPITGLIGTMIGLAAILVQCSKI